MNEDEKNLNEKNVEETKDMPDEREQTDEEERKTIGQKIADIDSEDVGKKVDRFVGWISEKLKGLKIDKSTPEGKKKAKERRNAILGLAAFILIGNFLNDGKITDIIPAKFVVAKLVEESTPVNYPNMTYGEAFDALCDNGSWKYVTKEKGIYYVEYNGKLKRSSDGKGILCVQFAVDKDSDYFNISYLEYEGKTATNELEYSTSLYMIFEAADYMIKNGGPADTTPVNSFSNKVGSTQAAALAPTVPETEDDYVFDPNGAAKADSYYDEESAVYSTEEASGDLPDDSSDMPEYVYIPSTSNTYPELKEYPVWKELSNTWYAEESGLFVKADIKDGVPVLIFSTTKNFDQTIYTLYPNDGDGAWSMGVYGNDGSKYVCQGDLVDSNGKNPAYVIALWDDINDYTKINIWIDTSSSKLEYPIDGYYDIQ